MFSTIVTSSANAAQIFALLAVFAAVIAGAVAAAARNWAGAFLGLAVALAAGALLFGLTG